MGYSPFICPVKFSQNTISGGYAGDIGFSGIIWLEGEFPKWTFVNIGLITIKVMNIEKPIPIFPFFGSMITYTFTRRNPSTTNNLSYANYLIHP